MLNREQMIEEILNKVYPDVMINTIVVDGKVSYVPTSLSRVLSALGYEYFYREGCISHSLDNEYDTSEIYIDRKLLNEDNTDAMLNDQSDETIKAIHTILFPTSGKN